MMKINNYTICIESRNVPLEVSVINFIENGWQPLGQPYVDKNGAEKQAMVKYEEAKPKTKKKVSSNED